MKKLYKKLAELEPARWNVYGDYVWITGSPSGLNIHRTNGLREWLDKTLTQEGVTRIDRADGQSWEEAMLTALVAAVEKRVKG